jgi:hypothetical protein
MTHTLYSYFFTCLFQFNLGLQFSAHHPFDLSYWGFTSGPAWGERIDK